MSLSKGLGAWALTPVGGLVVVMVAAVTATGGLFLTSAAKADFSVAASPASQSVAQGQSALFTVTLDGNNGFASPVQFTASGLPTGASASFSPVQVTKGSGTSSMSVTTANDTPTGTSTITVTGTGGSLVHRTTVSLTVTPHVAPAFSLSAAPGSSTMLPGDTATYQVTVAGTAGFSGSVALSTIGALPSGMATSFSPAAVTPGQTSTLTVTTKNNTASGNYTLTVAGNSAGQQQQTTTVGLNLNATGRSFTITGPSFSNVAPGVSVPLDLTISNPNNQALNVTNLTVTVQSVTKASGTDPNLNCTTADYVVTQYGGAYPLTVGAGASGVKLSALDNNAAHLPTIGMLNSTTANQDGCRGASVVLAFTGAGQGG